MSLDYSTRGLDAVLSQLGKLGANIKNPKRALTRIGLKVQGQSRKNAPIGPTAGDLKKLRKTNRKRRRKAGTTTRPKPGGLQNAITIEVSTDQVAIRVPSNTTAGKYAWTIHNEKGKRWRNRGPGTVRKGPQADHKFIDRAVEMKARDGTIEKILRDEIEREAGLD